jgi:glycerol-3-phosphate dehydrogenase (NAD(P)+)
VSDALFPSVAVVGRGEFAEVLVALVAAAGVEARQDREVTPQAAVDLEFWVVPAGELRVALRARNPGPASRIVVASRGLEPGSGLRASQLIEAESACLRVGALAGPILPGEVRRSSPCAAVVASRYDEVCRLAGTVLRSPLLRLYQTHDLAGVELAGALVEVFAVALGAARGLGLGTGAEALLVARAAVEGARLAQKIGGDPRTFSGLAGVGDLVASSASPDHPGHRRGVALASARGADAADLVRMCDALLAHAPGLPIVGGVRAVAAGHITAAEVLTRLMASAHAGEWDDV